jgi:hypothetical protein
MRNSLLEPGHAPEWAQHRNDILTLTKLKRSCEHTTLGYLVIESA